MMHSPFCAVSGRAIAVLVLLCSFASFSQADVRFTEPTAGSNVTAGQIDVRWEDSGISPPISQLTQYTLSLMVGGNENEDMQAVSNFESQGSFTTGDTAHGTIPEGIAADVPNGFFFRMTSTRQKGGVVTNYSDRFSIPGLSGDTALNIKQAAQALDGPPPVGNSASSSSSTATGTSAPTATTSGLTSSSPTSEAPTQNAPTNPVIFIATPDDDDDNTSSGLSKSATAAVAVAATLAIIAACAALAHWYLLRRRRKQNEVQEITPGTIFPDAQTPMHELSAENLLKSPRRAWTHQTELSSESMIYEAGSGERPPELDYMPFRAELEGDTPVTTPLSPGLDVMAFRGELNGGSL